MSRPQCITVRHGAMLALCLALLSACSTARQSDNDGGNLARVIECAPFAREMSGIKLYGPAYSWWDGAAGRYPRQHQPVLGSVIVFERSARLPSGHVSVVVARTSAREIAVTHANWVRSRVSSRQLVADVSPANDWSRVRVFWPPSGMLGASAYAVAGFVGPASPID